MALSYTTRGNMTKATRRWLLAHDRAGNSGQRTTFQLLRNTTYLDIVKVRDANGNDTIQ